MTVWDPAKAQANLRKHGVRFSDAEGVLLDPHAITVDDDSAREPRYVSIGLDIVGRVVVAVFTYRGEDVRLISARLATRRERQQYEKGIRLHEGSARAGGSTPRQDSYHDSSGRRRTRSVP
ncbi:MAG: BrnT family toxin [Acidobacteria bacterium]|nr:BrnT family toxin [Acidobacteriota bacterium]